MPCLSDSGGPLMWQGVITQPENLILNDEPEHPDNNQS